MQIVNISQVRGNKNNPRVIKDERFKKLVESIKFFPEMLWKRCLVVESNEKGYTVLGGNQRLRAINEIFKMPRHELQEQIAGVNKEPKKISTKFLTQETMRILRDGGFYPFPVKNMGTYSEKAKSFIKSKNNHPGISDIIAVSPEGKFWGVEIKNETTKDKQSIKQMIFEREVKKRGGIYRLVRNLNDIYKLLETDPY